MRTERNKDGTWNVWLSREEYRGLPRQAWTNDEEISIRLMSACGLRVSEVLDVTPGGVSR
jgi:hypothetical protein